jgi:hypothetical protein
MGSSVKEPPTRTRANTPRPMPQLVTPHTQDVQPYRHPWGNHGPSWSNSAS